MARRVAGLPGGVTKQPPGHSSSLEMDKDESGEACSLGNCVNTGHIPKAVLFALWSLYDANFKTRIREETAHD